MKKKLLGVLFVLGLLLALPSVVSFAENVSGTCGAEDGGTNITWTLDDEGTFTISGTGAMADYDAASSVPWNGSVATIKTVVIEDGVSKIGANAFYGCKNLNSVTIAKSVNFIGFGAFLNCTRLTDVYYAGTQENWNSITKMDSMYNFILHYHCGATDNDNVYGDASTNKGFDGNQNRITIINGMNATGTITADTVKDAGIKGENFSIAVKATDQVSVNGENYATLRDACKENSSVDVGSVFDLCKATDGTRFGTNDISTTESIQINGINTASGKINYVNLYYSLTGDPGTGMANWGVP